MHATLNAECTVAFAYRTRLQKVIFQLWVALRLPHTPLFCLMEVP